MSHWTSDGYVFAPEEDFPSVRQGAGWIFATATGHTLLVKCARTGKWGFCKGHREPSDLALIDTARREAQEELGLTPDDYEVASEPFLMRSWSYHVEFRYALLKKPLEELKLQQEEISEARLVTIQELRSMAAGDSINRFTRKWLRLVKDL